jgi:flagellar basal-body rod protein FlgF
MNYGLYLSAAGALTSLHRQDVHANNLANMNTIGFKPDEAYTRHRLPERLESAAMVDPNWLMEQLGGSQHVQPTRVRLVQGPLSRTDNPLDLAISGDGFLVVTTSRGSGDEQLRLTRDGRLTLNEQGELVMASTGLKVLDAHNQPIRIDPSQGDVRIDSHGEITQNGRIIAQLHFVSPTDPQLLQKSGANLLRLQPGASFSLVPATGAIVQSHIEGSAVDPIMAMNAMISASKAVASNATMMQYHDHILGQAINTFGRVA